MSPPRGSAQRQNQTLASGREAEVGRPPRSRAPFDPKMTLPASFAGSSSAAMLKPGRKIPEVSMWPFGPKPKQPQGKKFKLSKEQIRPLALGRGGAIASDRITVDGKLVGYMYRSTPRNPQDSGWAFLAGDENEAYMNDSSRHAIYDVNTIANYDPEIIALLDAPAGSAFLRGPFGLVADPQGAPSEED